MPMKVVGLSGQKIPHMHSFSSDDARWRVFGGNENVVIRGGRNNATRNLIGPLKKPSKLQPSLNSNYIKHLKIAK